MKDGVRIINCARGGIVDEAALADAIKSGKVGGAAFDVFSKEPPEPDNPLLRLAGNVVTPHLGASTEEAQVNVAIDISEQIADVLQGKPARSAVNLPALSAEEMARVAPFLVLGVEDRQPAYAARPRHWTARAAPSKSVEVIFSGDFATARRPRASPARSRRASDPHPLRAGQPGERAGPRRSSAGSRSRSAHRVLAGNTCLLSVRAQSPVGERTICGTVYRAKDVRIVHIDGYRVDIHPVRPYDRDAAHTTSPASSATWACCSGATGSTSRECTSAREKERAAPSWCSWWTTPSATTSWPIRAFPGMETAQSVEL